MRSDLLLFDGIVEKMVVFEHENMSTFQVLNNIFLALKGMVKQ